MLNRPIDLSPGIGSGTQRAFALVVVGGLIPATPLTMSVLPTTYERAEGWLGVGGRRRRPEIPEVP